ncbi:hypothetical protein SLEP1_g51772 [Rubroshorea leprosula]|uniref:Uncharacterized protein n=1 Tax=Rubroshorea leprosula TaxID=152421 RepID=A0AAV5M519_9ROSI|nr:hypothetical protein SLEP1_g51772 [Rubroshorea leprosula]
MMRFAFTSGASPKISPGGASKGSEADLIACTFNIQDEAMSVVGSEVMPLEYGGMDSETSPSPTSSERTVEERGEEVVVGEEEEEIPSNVLESGDGVDGCYDPDLEIVSEAGGRGEKGWYHFGPRSSSKENKNLFSPGPSSIKGWKENFFFVDDTEWSRRDSEVEQLSAWKAKKAKQNNYKLNEDEAEEVEKLVREDGDVVDILYLTSSQAIEAAELYGPSSLSEAEMEEFTNAAGGLRIPKKPRKKSTTSAVANRGVPERERLPSTSARAVEVQPRPEPVMGGSEDVSEETAPLQRKKRRVAELEGRVDESASWTNALAQEYTESVRDRASLQRQCDVLRKEKEDLQKEKGELQKKNQQIQRRLDEVTPTVAELRSDNSILSTKLSLEERKRKICEEKLEAQDKYIESLKKGAMELKNNVELLVHNGMEGHIGNFLNSSAFEDILKLYRLPTAILAFTDCRKRVKAQYPEVDVTTVTFGEQEEGVEEDGESLCADFRPQITLRWERDAEGRKIEALQVFEEKKSTVGRKGTRKETAAEIKGDYMTCDIITPNPIPRTAVYTYLPGLSLRMIRFGVVKVRT